MLVDGKRFLRKLSFHYAQNINKEISCRRCACGISPLFPKAGTYVYMSSNKISGKCGVTYFQNYAELLKTAAQKKIDKNAAFASGFSRKYSRLKRAANLYILSRLYEEFHFKNINVCMCVCTFRKNSL